MKDFINNIKVVVTAVGAYLEWFLGGLDGFLYALILFIAVIFFYLSNEGISIIENASKMGLPIPDKLKDVLSKLSEEEEKHE